MPDRTITIELNDEELALLEGLRRSLLDEGGGHLSLAEIVRRIVTNRLIEIQAHGLDDDIPF